MCCMQRLILYKICINRTKLTQKSQERAFSFILYKVITIFMRRNYSYELHTRHFLLCMWYTYILVLEIDAFYLFFQIVPLKTIMNVTEKGSNFQQLKSLCFSVFSMCRWNLNHNVVGKSLTGFGPASSADKLIRKKEVSD